MRRLLTFFLFFFVGSQILKAEYKYSLLFTDFSSALNTAPSSGGVSTVLLLGGKPLPSGAKTSTPLTQTVFGEEYFISLVPSFADYSISKIGAKTEILGEDIPPAIWQNDNDPYFWWDVGVENRALVKGFSYSLDSLPDRKVDTPYFGVEFPPDSIEDGKHFFYVMAYGGGKVWGEVGEFELWVDTEPPFINELRPQSGELISDSQVKIGCRIRDFLSGVDKESLKLFLNTELQKSANFDEENELFSANLNLEEGENTIEVEAQDKAGNLQRKTWGVVVDLTPPEGSLLINNGADITNYPYVSLKIEAEDNLSGIKYIYLSNDGIFDTEMLSPLEFRAVIDDWLVENPQVSGKKTVYMKLEDKAGNLSPIFSDDIELIVMIPDTRIISAPPPLTTDKFAHFYFVASRAGCKFSYSLDGQDFSEWTETQRVDFEELSLGNHLFKVKAGFDMNGDGLITKEEEDPTPAQWMWTIREEGFLERLQRILYWRRR